MDWFTVLLVVLLVCAGVVFAWREEGRRTPPCTHAETDDGKLCCICCGTPGASPCSTCTDHIDPNYCKWGCLPCSYVEECSEHS